uniref:Uncharacterized protein n=1 Tax=Octopus bimaculoides TaxID=37653 RepID=A0A0L8FTE4_OCTBM
MHTLYIYMYVCKSEHENGDNQESKLEHYSACQMAVYLMCTQIRHKNREKDGERVICTIIKYILN